MTGLLTQTASKRFNIRVIGRFAEPEEIERYLPVMGPAVQGSADKLAAVIYLDALGYEAQLLLQARHHGYYIFAFERLADVDSQALATKMIDYR